MSAKTRLFLIIEKLKNAMEDAEMRFPFWEKLFPLFGNVTVNIEVSMISEMINEAVEMSVKTVTSQGLMMYSQFIQNGSQPPTVSGELARSLHQMLGTNRMKEKVVKVSTKLDTDKYFSAAQKITNYFVSASNTSTSFLVKDVVKLYLYLSHMPKYRTLFIVLEDTLFRLEKECSPSISSENINSILENIRELTGINSLRLDADAIRYMNLNVQRAVNNELGKYPNVKVQDINRVLSGYENEVDPVKAYTDKFERLMLLETFGTANATDVHIRKQDPATIDSIAANIEMNCDMSRMVFNAINNIFINALEQSAAENIKFDVNDYNKRFRLLDRVRENSRKSEIEKAAVGDVITRKRAVTNLSTTPIGLKRNRVSRQTILE
ncbi:budded virus and occlusion derived virus capsid protein 42 [Phthorimaea operculella granulovirus]|uniref:Budded virus and occlusion derived virus capsid protein 42 n=1 Tax=Phthorimaea operculella granulovirus TaxID=192584 RepID=Q8JRY2_9BBAC|nr:budded virus and occlusion derived virus capsid protein 42 [Phthorimaea operculella granulovirus]AAM70275.1 budded virus and occlusion derived virus capsid protein 42 [Phthorimaea operculella granulovirus]ANY57466.1 budded virus and occlusion derived virus capsid protein 42 [Phthorimaea operculella granulovirus]QBH65912.1 budded virus and occlusion derived virus capsid protein 42 [Phthorimaea operculella granulovirus]QBH66042.1 budded virus and occlusion derived virus capsid protein 42 [Phth